MYRIRYFVHYTKSDLPVKRSFGPDRGAAITWARVQPAHANPTVVAVTTETIWTPESDN